MYAWICDNWSVEIVHKGNNIITHMKPAARRDAAFVCKREFISDLPFTKIELNPKI